MIQLFAVLVLAGVVFAAILLGYLIGVNDTRTEIERVFHEEMQHGRLTASAAYDYISRLWAHD